jgi:hypothetical protein
MPFDKSKAAKHADAIALPKYGNGHCAHHVYEALDKGGLNATGHPAPAKDGGPTLIKMGFKTIGTVAYTPELGDVAVFQAITGHPNGHMEIYDGKAWVSDFVQDDFYPSHSYEHARAQYAIYRYQ